MRADQRTGELPDAVSVTSVVSPLVPAVTARCPGVVPRALTTSTETSEEPPLVTREPGPALAFPAFS